MQKDKALKEKNVALASKDIAIAEQLVAKHPTVAEYSNTLADSHENIGMLEEISQHLERNG